MAYDLSSLGTYTTAEQIKAVDHAIMTIMLGGQVLGINGRQMTRASLDSLREYRKELEQRLADETSTSSSGIAIVRIGEPA